MREEVESKLSRIGKGLRAYEKQVGHLPPPALYSPDGRPLLSWRVLLLPHLGEQALYQQFHLNEPWDSPHNRTLLEKLPSVYETDTLSTRVPHGTLYQLVTGPGTLYDGRQGPARAAVKDGREQTILVVDAGATVEWTKPEDVVIAADKPLPALGGTFWDGFHVLFADGNVRFLHHTVTESTLRALLSPSGGEKVDLKKLP
jgi:hypothetical protein